MNSLELQQVRFAYPTGAKIYAHFRVPAGGAAALMGASGVGKSTVLNLIAGLLRPQSGDVLFGDESLLKLPPAARPLTYLFQDDNLFAHLTVWQNIAIGLHPGLRVDSADRVAIARALDWVGLADFAARLPASLSGGQRQRVALARCFARRRPLLLLDEPFTGVDAARKNQLLELLREMQQQRRTTLLITSHNRADAEGLNAEIIKM